MVKFKPFFERRYPRLERAIAIIALINLGLVFFDLTYLSLRQVYRQHLPVITQVYDPVKGVQVHPETEYYQTQVDNLAAQIEEAGVQSPQVEDALTELQTLSQKLITENTLVAPNGEYALANLQQSLRARTGAPFASDAFNQFWSTEYLAQRGWQQELQFWNAEARPVLESNYYRRVNQWGVPVDYFWLLDLPFMLIFAVDIALRILSLRRRDPDLTWLDVALRRWYDIFLLLPFWRWLRVVPVSLRLYQVDLLDLEPIRAEAQRDTIVAVGADLAGIVGVQLIDQLEEAIREGDLMNWLAAIDPDNQNGASQQNGSVAADAQEEVFAIANHLYDVSLQHVLPRIQPEVEDLVQLSLTKTLQQVPGYPQLNQVPGLGKASAQVLEQLSSSMVHGLYHGIAGTLLDEEGKEITNRLQRNLREAIVDEFNQHNTPQEVQSRLLSVLDKFRHKYVKTLVEVGGEKLAERTELLRREIS